MRNWVLLLYTKITDFVETLSTKLNYLENTKENLSNKRTSLDNPNDTTYPSTSAVKTAIEEIPDPNDGNLSISTSDDLEGSGEFSANQASDTNINISLSEDIKEDISQGVEAYEWGDHSVEGYAKENWVQGELDKKVDKEAGKGLSSNDFRDSDKSKLDGIEAGAQVNIKPDWGAPSSSPSGILNKPDLGSAAFKETSDFATAVQGDKADTAVQPENLGDAAFSNDYEDLDNKPTIPIVDYPVTSVNGKIGDVIIDKSDLDLEKVDNTSDLDKPISDATQDALDDKVDKETGKGLSSNDFTDTEKTKLSTIEEGAQVNVKPDWEADESDTGGILNKPDLGTASEKDIEDFASAEQGEKADSAVQPDDLADVATSGSYEDLTDKPTIPTVDYPVTSVNSKTGDVILTKGDVNLSNVDNVKQATKTEFDAHVNDEDIHVTTDEKDSWDAKETPAGAQSKVDSHANRTDNPHNVTAKQLDLDLVDNTSDLDKPVSDATQTELNKKVDKTTEITGGAGVDVGGSLSSGSVNVSINDTYLNNRYLRKDQDDSNGSNTLTLGGITSGEAEFGEVTLPSLLTGSSSDELLIVDSNGVVKKISPSSDVEIGIDNGSGTNQFNLGATDSIRFEGSGDTSISFNASTKTVTINSIPGSGTGGAVTSFNSRTGGVVSEEGDYNTGQVTETSNLYFTEVRVRMTGLDGLSTLSSSQVSENDSILQGIGKLQAQSNLKVNSSRKLTVSGTSGRVVVSGGEQDLASDREWTVDLVQVSGASGTHVKVTVDSYGRVTEGSSLVAGDIPNLPASKITSGTLNIARIPTGTSGTTVALGNDSRFHTHSNKSILDGTTASFTTALKNKLDGLSNYTLPTASASVLGGIKVGNNLSIDNDGVLSSTNTNTTYSAGTGLSLSGTTFSISQSVRDDIAKGVTAHGWGDYREWGLGNNSVSLGVDSSLSELDANQFYSHSTSYAPIDAPIASQAIGMFLSNMWGRFWMHIPNNGSEKGDVFIKTAHSRSGVPTEDWYRIWTDGNLTKLSDLTNDLGNYGNWITQVQGDARYQRILTAGSNIALSNNTISATDTTYSTGTKSLLDTGTSTGVRVYSPKVLSDWLAGKGYSTTDTTYTAGTNVSISSSNVISATDTKYTAGSNISISGTTISSTNTTYSKMSLSEINTGSNSTGRIVSADTLKAWIDAKGFVTTDTKYSAGTGLTLNGTTFSLNTTYTDNRYVNQTDFTWGNLQNKPATFPPSSHTHNASDINAGVLNIARIPTGTSGTTVALGNHTHTFASLTNKPTTLGGYGITDGVFNSRQVIAGDGLTGGGNLTANRTIALSSTTQSDIAKGVQAKEAVDGLEIGGRNYFSLSNLRSYDAYNTHPVVMTESSFETTIVRDVSGSTSVNLVLGHPDTQLPYIAGQHYVVSGFIQKNGEPISEGFFRGNTINTRSSSWQKKSFFIGENGYFESLLLCLVPYSYMIHASVVADVGDVLHFDRVQVEEGNKATDWTPAPEDQVTDWDETNEDSFAFLKNKPTKLSDFTNDLGNYGNWITKAQGDTYYSSLGHTHTFASLTSKPTTIAGYGITDFNSLGDARWALRSRTITGTGSLTGGGNLTANRTLDLTSTAKSDIAKGVTAHGWGDFREFGLGVKLQMSSFSLNDLQGNQFYGHSSSNTPPEAPTTSQAMGLFLNNTWGRFWLHIPNNGREKGKLFFKTSSTTSGETTEDWREIYHSGNLRSNSENDARYLQSSDISGLVPTSRTITAGNGLSGGGTLAANRTITLGTPGAITLSSTNSVTSTSHTHEFKPGGTTSQYIRGDGSLATYANTTYSAGTLALLQAGTNTSNRVWSAKILSDYVGAAGNFVKKSGDTMTDKLTISNSSYQRHLAIKRGDIEIEFSPSTANNGEMRFLSTNATRYLFDKDVRSEGDIIAYSSSDSRLKDNIQKLTNPIDRINKIGGYSFQWNNKQDTYEGDDVGLLAQEIENIIPSAVTTRKNGYKAVKYEKVIPLLVEGIKELSEENKDLKKKNEELEKRLDRLEAIINGS